MDIKICEYAKKRLHYDGATGVFTWLNGPRKGKPAGSVNKKNGYRYIHLLGKNRLEHRLAYYFLHGVLPHNVDHRSGVRVDNTEDGIRRATTSNNAWNSKKPSTNTSGHKGVKWFKRTEKWTCGLYKHGRYIFGGYFTKFEDAVEAYSKLSKLHHGEFSNLGEYNGCRPEAASDPKT